MKLAADSSTHDAYFDGSSKGSRPMIRGGSLRIARRLTAIDVNGSPLAEQPAGPHLVDAALATKLLVPALGPEVVPRPRLVERLNEATQRRVTLVAAPAGFGKTTAVAAWIATTCQPVAWLALDEARQRAGSVPHPTRWRRTRPLARRRRYAAPQLVERRCAGGPSSARCSTTWRRRARRSPSCSTTSRSCSRRRCSTRSPSSSTTSHPTSTWCCAPAASPACRCRGCARAASSPRSPSTTSASRSTKSARFLEEAMALRLSPKGCRTLHARTEGWITGLQLAALSLRRTLDSDRFIASFAGDHRHVADYLMDEVLRRLPPGCRSSCSRRRCCCGSPAISATR